MKVTGDSHCPKSYHGSMCYATENKLRHAWERLCQNLQWDVLPGWVSNFVPLGEGKLLSLRWDPLSCCKLDLLKCTLPGMEHVPLKEGRRWGSWSDISCVQSSSSRCSCQHVWYVQPGQVPTAANLPVLKARWAHAVFYWYNHLATVFLPSVGLEDIASIEALTIFTQ